ncbi:hypothetical protein EMCG_07715 [[Emmonsia] crescens]|uniref:Uncharacterized protein n=1 Tax=[Emmonsia] crescens TaxID=73230 RepID=A0A0G2JAZ7_9EURO|nr:hypothetical protein EMCG_07715 [Emmonsia crescens UAMH 3008]
MEAAQEEVAISMYPKIANFDKLLSRLGVDIIIVAIIKWLMKTTEYVTTNGAWSRSRAQRNTSWLLSAVSHARPTSTLGLFATLCFPSMT